MNEKVCRCGHLEYDHTEGVLSCWCWGKDETCTCYQFKEKIEQQGKEEMDKELD